MVVINCQIDLDMFMEDWDSDLVKQVFYVDQWFVFEMNIIEVLLVVVFDCD